MLYERMRKCFALAAEQNGIPRVNQVPLALVPKAFAWRYTPHTRAVTAIDLGELCDVGRGDEFRTTTQGYRVQDGVVEVSGRVPVASGLQNDFRHDTTRSALRGWPTVAQLPAVIIE